MLTLTTIARLLASPVRPRPASSNDSNFNVALQEGSGREIVIERKKVSKKVSNK